MSRNKCTVKRCTVLPFDVSGSRPFKFNRQSTVLMWVVRTYKDGRTERLLITASIRPGFMTDGASTFWPFSNLVPQWRKGDDNYNAGPTVHDILYILKGHCHTEDGKAYDLSREEVDDILRGIWRCWGMSRFLAGCADKAIEMVAGGSNHWGNDSYKVRNFCDITVEVLE